MCEVCSSYTTDYQTKEEGETAARELCEKCGVFVACQHCINKYKDDKLIKSLVEMLTMNSRVIENKGFFKLHLISLIANAYDYATESQCIEKGKEIMEKVLKNDKIVKIFLDNNIKI